MQNKKLFISRSISALCRNITISCHVLSSLALVKISISMCAPAELSIADMATVVDSLRASQSSGKGPKGGARVEAFVHGAMCVSYSGQCLSSEAWGGRSANRGQCAQACRLPYGLVVDGDLKELLDDTSYLLSPQVCVHECV